MAVPDVAQHNVIEYKCRLSSSIWRIILDESFGLLRTRGTGNKTSVQCALFTVHAAYG